jgi:hypothetical protein
MSMREIFGYVFLGIGLVVVILQILAWIGAFTPKQGRLNDPAGQPGLYDVLLALIQKLPWVAILGLLLIVAGLILIGVGPIF